MDSFFNKAKDRIEQGLREAQATFNNAGGLTKEHSHTQDGAGDQHHDTYESNNRFQSFAPQTSGDIKWYVDGASYFWAVSMALENAKESIYILDWWLSPELYLRRPPAHNERYRLDKMLHAAAERGVDVRIIVYKEVAAALTCDSAHTKHALEGLHENIKVFRHPDHTPNSKEVVSSFSTLSLKSYRPGDLAKASTSALASIYGQFGDSVLYWAHHEKLCVVDRRVGFMGGLDMCFGRWDTMSHPIADAHPGNLENIIFPGQDFNNARAFDFEGVNNWNHQNKLDRAKNGRMGWSDITVSMVGPIVTNLLDHFIDRWNFIQDEKYSKKDRGKYNKLSLDGGAVIEEHHIPRNMHEMHGRFRRFMGNDDENEGEHERRHESARRDEERHESAAIQLCRSCCEWSGGHPTEHSIANAYIDAITNAKHFVYIENQFFITATSDAQKPVTNKIGLAIVNRIVRAQETGEDFRIVVIMPAVPAFAGDLKSEGALGTRAILEFQYQSISRGGHSIIEVLQQRGVQDWQRYIGFYNLRNYDRLNTSSTMQRAEEQSGVSYDEARQGYDQQHNEGPPVRNEAYSRYQYAAGKQEDSTWDTVSSCYMEGGTDIRQVPWNGSPEAEMDAFISEELYIHSKVLIADDRLVICGSANLNDRSQLGNHDSEIAVVIEDPTPVESRMAGRPYTASKFAASLRRQLFRKHLGLVPDQRWDKPTPAWTPVDADPQDYDWGSRSDQLVEDPLGGDFLRLWSDTARTNTEVFNKTFHPVPNDAVRNWEQYDEYFGNRFIIPGNEYKNGEDKDPNRVMYGHVVKSEFPGGVGEVKEWLSRVRGTLVDMPLDFLVELGDDLAMEGVGLNFATKEIYT